MRTLIAAWRSGVVCLALAACAPGDREEAPPWLYGEVALTIGADTVGSSTTFGAVSGLAFAPGGRILVSDRQDHLVRVFSSQGALVYTLGRPGRGPGDLGGPCCLAVRGDTLWVKESENRRYSAFLLGDTVATFLRTISGGANSVWSSDRVDFDSAHRLIDLQSAFDRTSGSFRTLRQFRDAAGAVVREDTMPAPPKDSLDLLTFSRAGGVTTYYPEFGARALHAYGAGGQSAHAVSTRYAVEWRDAGNRRVALLERAIGPGPPLAPDERARSDSFLVQTAREAGRAPASFGVETPTHRPPVEELGFDLAGRLWIQHTVPQKTRKVADVYATGRWVARASWPADVYLPGYSIRDSMGLGVAVGDDGEERVVVVRWRTR